MEITTEQRQAMQDAYEQKNFKEILKFGDQILGLWEKQNCIGDSEFDTLRLTFEKEFKVKGLVEFFHTLYRIIYDQDSKVEGKPNEHDRLQSSEAL